MLPVKFQSTIKMFRFYAFKKNYNLIGVGDCLKNSLMLESRFIDNYMTFVGHVSLEVSK